MQPNQITMTTIIAYIQRDTMLMWVVQFDHKCQFLLLQITMTIFNDKVLIKVDHNKEIGKSSLDIRILLIVSIQ
jgi:hypothetical protein